MSKPLKSTRKLPTPPRHLEQPERDLWQRLVRQFHLDDAASLAVLVSAMEASGRARRCRERIDADGEAVADRFGQQKPHALLGAERDGRGQFLQAMRLLRLADIADLAEDGQ